MLKRRTGIYLLTLLVITGLAGTISDNTISKSERKASINLMKDSRTDVMKEVKGLSESQLNFKESPEKWSIKECVYHIAITEKSIWDMLEGTMKSPANPEKRSEIKMSDELFIKMIEDRSNKVKTSENFEPKNTPYKSLDEAIETFKNLRTDHIKYMRSTTEDLRSHVIQMPFGWIDCYQLSLMIGAHSNRHTQQINEVKASSGFPSK